MSNEEDTTRDSVMATSIMPCAPITTCARAHTHPHYLPLDEAGGSCPLLKKPLSAHAMERRERREINDTVEAADDNHRLPFT